MFFGNSINHLSPCRWHGFESEHLGSREDLQRFPSKCTDCTGHGKQHSILRHDSPIPRLFQGFPELQHEAMPFTQAGSCSPFLAECKDCCLVSKRVLGTRNCICRIREKQFIYWEAQKKGQWGKLEVPTHRPSEIVSMANPVTIKRRGWFFSHVCYIWIYWLVVWIMFIFLHILGKIIPTDKLIFFRGVQ